MKEVKVNLIPEVQAVREVWRRHALLAYSGHFTLWVLGLSAYSQAPGLVLACMGALLHFSTRFIGLAEENVRLSLTLFYLSLVSSGAAFFMYMLRDAPSLPPMGVQ